MSARGVENEELRVFGIQDAVAAVAVELREWFPIVHADNMLGIDGKEPRTRMAAAFRALLDVTGITVRIDPEDGTRYECECDPNHAAA